MNIVSIENGVICNDVDREIKSEQNDTNVVLELNAVICFHLLYLFLAVFICVSCRKNILQWPNLYR